MTSRLWKNYHTSHAHNINFVEASTYELMTKRSFTLVKDLFRLRQGAQQKAVRLLDKT